MSAENTANREIPGDAALAAGTGAPRPPGGSHCWSRHFGGVSTQDGWSIAVDANRDVLVTGSFYETIDFGGGPLSSQGGADIFVVKLRASGGHVWSRHFGGGAGQVGQSIAVDAAHNVIVAGAFLDSVDLGGGVLKTSGETALFVTKLDPAGGHVWSKSFGESGRQGGQSVAVDAAGNILLAGTYQGSIGFGGPRLESAGSTDVFLAKLDPEGGHVWSKSFGDAGYQRAQGVTVDPDGNVLITGTFEGTMDFGGGPLTSAGTTDIFIAKLDPSGNHLWSKRFGDSDGQGGQSIAVDPRTGSVIVAGYFSGMIDFGGRPLFNMGAYTFFLAKLDACGRHVWSGSFGSTTGPYTASIAVDQTGCVLVTGPFEGMVDFGGGPLSSAGNKDILIAKLREDGEHLWSRCFGDSGDEYGQSIAVDADGDVLVVGSFSGTLNLGGGPLTSRGGYDIFVLKLAG